MFFKCLDAQGCSCHGGNYRWSLPTQNVDGTWTPGDWTPVIDTLIICENGYHLAENSQVLQWLSARIFIAEYRGNCVRKNDKIVVSQCRLLRELTKWNERTARLFAVWCARGALTLVDHPDPRSIAVCDVAELFANGAATAKQLAAAGAAAAMYAAGDAALVAAWDAALDAAWDAAMYAAWDAARDAAWAAVRAATRVAAWDAAWDAARDAQYEQFCAMTVK